MERERSWNRDRSRDLAHRRPRTNQMCHPRRLLYIKRCFEEKILEKSRSFHDKISFFCFSPQKNYEYFIIVYFYAFSFSKCHHWAQFLFSFSDNFLCVEFCFLKCKNEVLPPAPAGHSRSRALLDSFLVSSSSQFLRDAVFVFYALAFVPRIFAYAAIDKGVLEKHLRYIFLSTSLSSNFAWASLAFVLLFPFAGSETGNEGSRSGAKG